MKDVRSGELHDWCPIGFDWRGRGRFGVRQGVRLLGVTGFMKDRDGVCSIAIEIVAPEAVSSHPSSIGAVGSELRVRADTGAASWALFGGRARSCPS